MLLVVRVGVVNTVPVASTALDVGEANHFMELLPLVAVSEVFAPLQSASAPLAVLFTGWARG